MSKREPKLKPQYSANLETLIKEQNITKKDLAGMIHTSAQTISKACNGVRLTKPMAESIIKEYPQYNIAWLLGLSGVKYKKDVDAYILQEHTKSVEASSYQETYYDTVARLARTAGFDAFFNGSVFTIGPSKELAEQGFEEVILSFKNAKLLEMQEDINAFIKYYFECIIKRGQK